MTLVLLREQLLCCNLLTNGAPSPHQREGHWFPGEQSEVNMRCVFSMHRRNPTFTIFVFVLSVPVEFIALQQGSGLQTVHPFIMFSQWCVTSILLCKLCTLNCQQQIKEYCNRLKIISVRGERLTRGQRSS